MSTILTFDYAGRTWWDALHEYILMNMHDYLINVYDSLSLGTW